MQADKTFRWDYDYIEIGEAQDTYSYGLTDLDDDFHPFMGDSGDEWSQGSSSSFSAGNRSPSAGLRSPVDDPEAWEGETLASGSEPDLK